MEFWEAKIARNRHRDEVTSAHLEALGWTVITIWECELRGKVAAKARMDALADDIHHAGEKKAQREKSRRIGRATARKERELMLERQKKLEEEIKKMFPISKKIQIASKEEL